MYFLCKYIYCKYLLQMYILYKDIYCKYLLQMYFLWMYLHVIVFTLQTNNLHWSVYMQLYLQRLQIYISNTFCKCIYMWPNENAHFQKSSIIFNDTLWTRKLGWKRINRKTLWLGGWEKTNRGANRSASIYAMHVRTIQPWHCCSSQWPKTNKRPATTIDCLERGSYGLVKYIA